MAPLWRGRILAFRGAVSVRRQASPRSIAQRVNSVRVFIALTPFMHTVWYYLGGIAMTALAIYNMYKCSQLPKRTETLPNGKKPVW